MTPEGRVKEIVKRRLRGACWFYMPVQNGMGVTGIPDIIACVPVEITPDMVGKTFGMFLGVETKAPGKEHTVTANQRRQLDGISDNRGVALVVSDPDAQLPTDVTELWR